MCVVHQRWYHRHRLLRRFPDRSGSDHDRGRVARFRHRRDVQELNGMRTSNLGECRGSRSKYMEPHTTTDVHAHYKSMKTYTRSMEVIIPNKATHESSMKVHMSKGGSRNRYQDWKKNMQANTAGMKYGGHTQYYRCSHNKYGDSHNK